MRTAETILNIIQDRGKRQLPLDDVYRQLYNPDMYLRAYAKLYRNDGAMTPGTTGETVDGMSLDKIDRVIEALRFERWTWPPSRRNYIDKPKGGGRSLEHRVQIACGHTFIRSKHSIHEALQVVGPRADKFRKRIAVVVALSEKHAVWT